MNRGVQVLVGGLVAALVLAAAAYFGLQFLSDEPAVDQLSVAVPDEGAAEVVSAPEAALREAARAPTPAAAADAVEEAPEIAAAADGRPQTGWLKGTVLNTSDRPVGGAEVVVSYHPTRDFGLLDLELKETEHTVAEGASAADGTFELRVPAGRPLHLTVTAAGYGVNRTQPVFAGETHEVRLELGAAVQGRVVLKDTGEPVPGVALRAFRDGTRGDVFSGETDSEGRYRFENIEPGLVTIDCRPERYAAPDWRPVQLLPGEVFEQDFVLERGVIVRGRVTDAKSGAPVADAELWEGWFGRKRVRTDVNGDYELAGFGGPGVYDIHVHARGYGRAQHEFDSAEMPEDGHELDFELVPAHRASGRILDPAGAPVEGAYVAAVDSHHAGGVQETDWISTRTDAEGRYLLDSLTPGFRHALFVQKTGYATMIYNFPPGLSEGDLVLPDVRLEPSGRMEGVIVQPDGTPIPGMTVMMKGWNADYGRYTESDMEWGMDQGITSSYIGRRTTHTDALGRFFFSDLAAGTYELTSRKGRSSNRDVRDVVMAEGEWKNDVRIEYSLGLSISGHVVTVDGYGLANIQVRAKQEETDSRASATSAEGGAFRLEGLEPGTYQLVGDPLFYRYEEGEPRFAWTSIEVQAPRDDVRLVLYEAVELSGQVLDAEGKPWPKAFVFFKNPAGWQVAYDMADEEGRFSGWVMPNLPIDVQALATEKDSNAPGGARTRRGPSANVWERGVLGPRSDLRLQLSLVYGE